MASGFTSRAITESSAAFPASGNIETRAAAWLLCQTASRCFGFPAADIAETMRALPVEVVAGAPPFVLGVSVIRGEPVPIVDAAQLLGEQTSSSGRFITMRVGRRLIGFAIESVVGIRSIPAQTLERLPTLLGSNNAIEAMAALDEGLTFFLNAARAIPESVLAALDGQGGAHDL